MKEKQLVWILLLLSSPAAAGNDINISFDAQGLELCLAVDNLTNYVCNATDVLTVDGTSDHLYYFINKPLTLQRELNVTSKGDMINLIFTPYNLIASFLLLIVLVALAAITIMFIIKLIVKMALL